VVQNHSIALVSFDLDGTILHGRIMYHLRIPAGLHEKIVAQDVLYDQGKQSYEDSLRVQYSLLEGMRPDQIAPNVRELPLIRDLGTAIQELRRSHVRVVILTDNPSFAAEPLKSFGFDDIIGSEIATSNGMLDKTTTLLTNKLVGLRDYCHKTGIPTACCAHIGDWINDIVVFKGVGLSVAFNPSEEEVSESASFCVRSDSLLDVLRVLEPFLPNR